MNLHAKKRTRRGTEKKIEEEKQMKGTHCSRLKQQDKCDIKYAKKAKNDEIHHIPAGCNVTTHTLALVLPSISLEKVYCAPKWQRTGKRFIQRRGTKKNRSPFFLIKWYSQRFRFIFLCIVWCMCDCRRARCHERVSAQRHKMLSKNEWMSEMRIFLCRWFFWEECKHQNGKKKFGSNCSIGSAYDFFP